MQYYYIENILGDLLTLPGEESKHIVRVMRMREGDELMLVDGRGTLCRASIVAADPHSCEVRVTERREQWQPHPFRLHVAMAPTRNMARMEWFAEKATEVGIDVVSPVLCDHSERVHVNEERLNKIVVSAMKQSQRAYKPLVMPFSPLDQLIIDSDHAFDDYAAFLAGDLARKEASASRPLQKFICYCNGDDRMPLQQVYHKGSDVVILIGPEGDFSDSELQLARRYGFQPVTLGDTRLRTETAALAATFYLNFLNE